MSTRDASWPASRRQLRPPHALNAWWLDPRGIVKTWAA